MQFDVTAKSSASTSTIEYSNVSRWEITLAPGEILYDAQRVPITRASKREQRLHASVWIGWLACMFHPAISCDPTYEVKHHTKEERRLPLQWDATTCAEKDIDHERVTEWNQMKISPTSPM